MHASSPSYSLNSQDMVLHPLEQPLNDAAATAAASSPPSSSSVPVAAADSSSDAPPPALTVPPDVLAVAHACVHQLRRQLQLTLFGFDLIRATAPLEDASSSSSDAAATPAPGAVAAVAAPVSAPSLLPSSSPRYFIIDINYFPSYKTLTGLTHKIIQVCLKKQQQQQPQLQPPQQQCTSS